MKHEPLYLCTECSDDANCHLAHELKEHDGKLYCDCCWDEAMFEESLKAAPKDLPEWGDLPAFVPEHERRIAELEAEIEWLRGEIP